MEKKTLEAFTVEELKLIEEQTTDKLAEVLLTQEAISLEVRHLSKTFAEAAHTELSRATTRPPKPISLSFEESLDESDLDDLLALESSEEVTQKELTIEDAYDILGL